MKLAEFKRKAAEGRISLELINWHGETNPDEFPERLRGIRAVVKTNTVAVFLQGQESMKHSELMLKTAKLFECDGETLSVFRPGYRLPTKEEQALLDAWDQIEKEYEEKYPYGDCFWKKKHFFEKSAYPYMSGFEPDGPRKYKPEKKMVLDYQVRGDLVLQYKIHWNQKEE